MNLIVWAGTGALLGWLACFRLGTLCRTRLLIEATIGLAGALLAGLLNASADRWLSTDLQLLELATAATGAAVLLLIANLRARRSEPAE